MGQDEILKILNTDTWLDYRSILDRVSISRRTLFRLLSVIIHRPEVEVMIKSGQSKHRPGLTTFYRIRRNKRWQIKNQKH